MKTREITERRPGSHSNNLVVSFEAASGEIKLRGGPLNQCRPKAFWLHNPRSSVILTSNVTQEIPGIDRVCD